MIGGRRAGVLTALALAAVPTTVFALLLAAHQVRPLPGLIGWAICVGAACGFAVLLGRDLGMLAAFAAWRDGVRPMTALALPGMQALEGEIARLHRSQTVGRAEARALAAEDRVLVERLPDPLLKLDAGGNLVWRNATAAAAFGGETGALLRHPALRSALGEAAVLGAPVRRSLASAAPVARDLEIAVIPVGGPAYVLISDRTRERSIDRMRADFVANASHELRTPLASLIGFIETLRGPAADDAEAQARFLGIMAEQAQRMQRVIADLLSLSRIEMSEHEPPAARVDLAPLLQRAAAAMEPMLAQAGATLVLDTAPELPGVTADEDQLSQVLINLLDNAIKYGRRGGTIRLGAVPAADPRLEPGGVAVSVADDGPGIPREHLPRLTERFYRVDKGRSRSVGGTGLGLAIVKHVVNRHRGRLLIDSAEGKGTTFTIWLPAAKD